MESSFIRIMTFHYVDCGYTTIVNNKRGLGHNLVPLEIIRTTRDIIIYSLDAQYKMVFPFAKALEMRESLFV